MTTIGTFTLEAGIYQGRINTLTVSTDVSIIPVIKKAREGHPDFTVSAPDLDIGAAWLKTKGDRQYLSVRLDDPSFPEAINARLVKTGVLTYSLIWERPRLFAKEAA